MKISTKGRYGLRALIDLSRNGKNGLPVLLCDIAKRQGISDKYLEQIATQLHRAGLVKTVRGRKGGYLLSRPENQIKVSEVIEILEGPICVVDCVLEPDSCSKAALCSARDVWSLLSQKIGEVLSGYTLADLVKLQEEKASKEYPMYYI
ncbi:MAG TPA: Rrf2 family transcriptional regulator [Syntrophorhabdaceae bacterium]|nr:Rrf2 family transcriptional regulator [Syntrophorhabdaceae bacterium]